MHRSIAILASFLVLCLAVPAAAEHHEKAADAETGFLAEFSKDFDGVSKKLLDLAGATPAEKFSYRPTEEVRTVSEVYIHTALANFFLAQALGIEAPEAASQDAEKTVTKKEDVIEMLELSQKHVRDAIAQTDDLEAIVEVFGGERSKRAVLMIVAGHSHEHLGQSIAYARSAGVVPPWSR